MSPSKSKNPLPKPHDTFFREVFSRKEEASDFLKGILPVPILNNVDLPGLKLENTSYLDKQLKAHFSDIVYTTSYQSKTSISLAFLFEHKSFKPSKAPIQIQLMRYILNIWEQNQKQGKSLMPVIPIVVYHGKESWEAPSLRTFFQETYQLSSQSPLLGFIPEFTFLFKDLGKYTDEEIRSVFSLLSLQSALMTLKKIFETRLAEDLKTMRPEILALMQDPEGREFYRQILLYLYYGSNTDNQKIIEVMNELSQDAGQEARSTAELLIEQGRKLERQVVLKSTIASFIKSGDLSLNRIAEILEVPLSFVQNMAQGLQNTQ